MNQDILDTITANGHHDCGEALEHGYTGFFWEMTQALQEGIVDAAWEAQEKPTFRGTATLLGCHYQTVKTILERKET